MTDLRAYKQERKKLAYQMYNYHIIYKIMC